MYWNVKRYHTVVRPGMFSIAHWLMETKQCIFSIQIIVGWEARWFHNFMNIQGWKISRLYAKEADRGQYPLWRSEQTAEALILSRQSQILTMWNWLAMKYLKKIEDISAKQVYALYFILLVVFLFGGSRHCKRKRHRFKGSKKS